MSKALPFFGTGNYGFYVTISTRILETVSAVRTVVSDPASCSVTNGTAPFTYDWEKVSGETFSMAGDGSLSTTFSTYFSAKPGVRTGVYRLKVTDAAAAIAYSPTVEVSLRYDPY